MSNGELKLAAVKPPRHVPFRSDPERPTIGVLAPCYGASHTIYGLNTPHFRHEQLRTIPLSKLDRGGTFFSFTPLILDMDVALVHTWNAIPVNRNFIVSFELELPRYLGGPSNSVVKFGLRRLASERCRAILPLSDFAKRWASSRFEQFGFSHLTDKLEVFRGAVEDPLDCDLPVRPSMDLSREPFRAVLIGTQLFHKGATFAVEAFEQLRAMGYMVELTLIGNFETYSHGFRGDIPDTSVWEERVRSHDWITLCDPVSRAEVFQQLRQHHLCLHPSLDESLGWLPIEAQLCEVPVIANRVCAFPELVEHRVSGWLIDLPVSTNGRWTGMDATPAQRKLALAHAKDLIVRDIIGCVETVYSDPQLLERWGKAGRAKMLDMYSVVGASRQLEKIYEEALRR